MQSCKFTKKSVRFLEKASLISLRLPIESGKLLSFFFCVGHFAIIGTIFHYDSLELFYMAYHFFHLWLVHCLALI